MKLVKIGDCYLNLENITHADFEATPNGLVCMVYFNCQVSDGDDRNGVQASKIFTAAAARDLKAWLDLRLISMDKESR
jgi:hypothetical protein